MNNRTKSIFFLLLFVSTSFLSEAQSSKKNRFYHLIVGTYTKTQDNGLFVYKFDSQNGKLTFESATEGIKNPSYLAISENGNKVYSVNEGNDKRGVVSAFNFDQKNGKLSFINEQEAKGAGPCYISIAKDNKFIFTANYAGGSISVLPLKNDGSIGELAQLIQYEGSSINPTRQKEPHAHAVIFSPAGDILYAADLGTDKLYAYKYDSNSNQPLSNAPLPFTKIDPGFGPRQFTFNQTGSRVYLLSEMAATISVFSQENNTLNYLQNISMNATDFKGINGAAAIHLSNDGKFLYATNRGNVNEIVIFKVDTQTGLLERIGAVSSNGQMPRDFIIDPTDHFLLVAHQNSNDIFVFKRDQKTGLLSYINEKITLGSPVCLKMVAAK